MARLLLVGVNDDSFFSIPNEAVSTFSSLRRKNTNSLQALIFYVASAGDSLFSSEVRRSEDKAANSLKPFFGNYSFV